MPARTKLMSLLNITKIKPPYLILVLATASRKNITVTSNVITHIEAINLYTGMSLVDILSAFSVSE
jgi:hypothetical protein